MKAQPISRALLPRLASPEPVAHTLTVTGRTIAAEQAGSLSWPITLPTPTEWTLRFDETTRPYARATLVYPASAYDWTRISPAAHSTLTRLRLVVSYAWPKSGDTATSQLAVLIVTSIATDTATGMTTLTLESDETLQEWDACPPGRSYDVPDTPPDLGRIYADAQRAGGALYPLPLRVDAPVLTARHEAIYPLTLQPGNRYVEWVWTLAEAAGLWIHSNQRPDSHGGLIIEEREPAQPWGVDLSDTAPYPLAVNARRITSSEGAASHLDLTVEWEEGGKHQTTTRRYVNPNARVRRLAARTLKVRPPLVGISRRLPDNWAPALDLLERLSARTWTETVELRSLYWLRPRDPVTLNTGPALIAAIEFNGQTGLMTLTARPY